MTESFEYLFQVSGGWTQARLTLDDDIGQIEYDSASMGVIPVRYIAQGEHLKRSEFHGVLNITSIAQYIPSQNEFGGYVLTAEKELVNFARLIDPDADDEMLDFYNEFQLEYVRFPQPQQRLDEQGGNWGVYDRTETFSLILLIHSAGLWYDLEGEFLKSPIGRGLATLDKMHFSIAQGKYSPKL